jgi:hypothetical protein
MNALCLSLLALTFAALPLQAEPIRSEKLAETAAAEWLQLVDQGKAAESWQALASASRQQTGQLKWRLGFAMAGRKFGSLNARKLRSAQTSDKSPGGRPGEFVLLEYDSNSTKIGPVVEKLTVMHDSDGQWRVAGYTATKPGS